MLGHDLRNPLAAIDAGTKLLGKKPIDEQGRDILSLIERSVRRMAGLIDNVLDLTRARLGGGLQLKRNSDQPLGPVLDEVVQELRASWPDRKINVDITLPAAIDCDRARIAQLLSNLLANALTHGAADAPVSVLARADKKTFELSVTNQGEPIAPAVSARLFEPFYRPVANSGHQGLGLGLYIASEIARAHGGELTVTSVPEATRFVFKMPMRGSAI